MYGIFAKLIVVALYTIASRLDFLRFVLMIKRLVGDYLTLIDIVTGGDNGPASIMLFQTKTSTK